MAVDEPEAQIFAPVKAILRPHLLNEEIFALLGRLIIIVNLMGISEPPLFTKKVFAVPFAILVLKVTPVLVKV